MILKIIVLIAIIYSCDKTENPLHEDGKPNSENYQADSCSAFDTDTLNANLSFDKNTLITRWQVEKYYDLTTCEILAPDRKEIAFKEVSLVFYEGDSIIANCINEYKAKYTIQENGLLMITDWIGTKEYETEWGKTFDRIFPYAQKYYTTQDSILMIFTEKYKVKLIKILQNEK